MQPAVFICYRRLGTGPQSGRLFDHLARTYTNDGVFMDVDDISGGKKWHAEVTRALAQAKVMLAMIGPGWMTEVGDSGELRLFEPQDQVRREIELALDLDVTIIPVLVDGAVMPRQSDLPESIRALTKFHAVPLQTGATFTTHMEAILAAVNQVTGGPPNQAGQAAEAPAPTAPPPQLDLMQVLPGYWQLQITMPNGLVGQSTAQFFPTGQFTTTGFVGQAYQAQGTWQVPTPGSLLLAGQISDGFQVMPYNALLQMSELGPGQLRGIGDDGSQTAWTKVG